MKYDPIVVNVASDAVVRDIHLLTEKLSDCFRKAGGIFLIPSRSRPLVILER
jgi:hypothetical protein